MSSDRWEQLRQYLKHDRVLTSCLKENVDANAYMHYHVIGTKTPNRSMQQGINCNIHKEGSSKTLEAKWIFSRCRL